MPHKKGFEELLLRRFKHDENISGVEIGCFQGEFCHHLLNKFQNLYMTTIDPYAQYSEIFKRNELFLNRLNIVPLKSDWACKIITDQFDFVFIDGDHSYEQCKKDIENYLPLVKRGGFISGHNYHKAENSAHPGVHISVDEIFGDRVRLQDDFTWYVEV